MTSNESVPVLSTEEEAEWRAEFARGRANDRLGWWGERCERLLATVDAARARSARYEAAIAEADRIIERLRERIHPTMDGYCPECSGGCLIGFATPTPARDALTSEAHRG